MLGRDHAETLVLRRKLADQTQRAGLPRAAMEISRQIVETDVAAYGPRDLITLQDRLMLGQHAWVGGDWPAAVAIYEALIDDCGWTLGREDRVTLQVRFRHATAIGLMGDTIRARNLLHDVKSDQSQILGKDHRDTRETLTKIAYFVHSMPGPAFRPPMPPL
ncbi:hypothetical protein KGA66_22980 [Actinocrinis puniceicyclus]|uniref:Tetratricopeptide repeat protein n=1 Tax=Actinocrinis puniceicyclus TaxID=977794 RepID=A0A8J7WR15_9ACTN|nr:hypothetical protein [Actinocrinis puniceicyclus]MBS2965928.1 hypothetical protein [Actinocrinis puniceicyclus]